MNCGSLHDYGGILHHMSCAIQSIIKINLIKIDPIKIDLIKIDSQNRQSAKTYTIKFNIHYKIHTTQKVYQPRVPEMLISTKKTLVGLPGHLKLISRG